MEQLPEVLVTSCRGADQGALSVIRTLGRRGIRVSVLADSPMCLTRHSRHCAEFICRPDFTRDRQASLAWLQDFAARRRTAPVLFPTADPDLGLVSDLRQALRPHFRMFLGEQRLVESLLDKSRFHDLAILHGMPVPTTYAPESAAGFRSVCGSVRYPVVLKPSHPGAWTHPGIQKAVEYRKAVIVDSASELQRLVEVISQWNTQFLVQEYIVGADDRHYSAHAYVDAQGELRACFTGRKVRVHPAFAGSGCFVRSEHVPELVRTTREILRAIRYTGVAVLNFKQDSRSGKFHLHEINPRISQWNILATACGVDIPWIAYSEAAGLPVATMTRQSETLQYVDLRNDLKSLVAYLRAGVWTPRTYIGSLLQRRTVHQLFSLEDPGPFLRFLLRSIHGATQRLRHRGATVLSTPAAGPEADAGHAVREPAAQPIRRVAPGQECRAPGCVAVVGPETVSLCSCSGDPGGAT